MESMSFMDSWLAWIHGNYQLMQHAMPQQHTKHEKAALDLAENYRLQYENLFPSRSPLFIAPKNEAGIEKVISTFVQVDL